MRQARFCEILRDFAMRRKKFVLGACVYIIELKGIALPRTGEITTTASRLVPILRICSRLPGSSGRTTYLSPPPSALEADRPYSLLLVICFGFQLHHGSC